MLSRDNRIVALFVVLGLLLWFVSASVTDSTAIRVGVLVLVGVVLPTVINEYRHRSGGGR